MNLTHIVHEFSFGPFFPAISQPLDLSFELTERRECVVRLSDHNVAFTIFQYFVRVVPTTYIDAGRRRLVTSQVRAGPRKRLIHSTPSPITLDLSNMDKASRVSSTNLTLSQCLSPSGNVQRLFTNFSYGLSELSVGSSSIRV